MRPSPLLERLRARAPQYDRKPSVELGACLFRQVVALPGPCDRVREGADADRERERRDKTAAPGFQIRVPQSREPRVARRQLGELLQDRNVTTSEAKGCRDPQVGDAVGKVVVRV